MISSSKSDEIKKGGNKNKDNNNLSIHKLYSFPIRHCLIQYEGLYEISFKSLINDLATAYPRLTGTALPICLY